MSTAISSRTLPVREHVIWLALLGAPPVLILLLYRFPALNFPLEDHWFHLQIVTFATLVALVSGMTTFALLKEVADARAFFIPLGLGTMAGIFFVHGLATPGILVFPHPDSAHNQSIALFARSDLAVTWSAPFSLMVGAIFFVLASLHWSPRAIQFLLRFRLAVVMVLILAFIAYLFCAIAFPVPFEWLNQFNPVSRQVLALTTALLYLVAAIRFWNAYRGGPERLNAALAFAAVYLAEALAPMLFLPLWSLGWWLYHVLMVLAFCIALGAVLYEYEHARHFRLSVYFVAVGIVFTFLLALMAGELMARLMTPWVAPDAVNVMRWGTTALFILTALLMLGVLWLVVRRGDALLRADTAKLQQQQAELERARLTEALIPIGVAMGESLDADRVLELICRESHALFQVDTALLWYKEGDELVGRAAYGTNRAEFLRMRQPLRDNKLLGARVVREQRPLYVNQALTSDNLHTGLVARLNIESILGVPMFSQGQVVGALVLIDLQHPKRFGALDVELARLFAQQAAQALTNAQLYEKIQTQTHALGNALSELRVNYKQTLAALSAALDARDRETEGHSRRVTAYALLLADALNIQDVEPRQAIEWGALLHDVGKIGVPDAILQKPGPLTPAEWVAMRQHPEIGFQILRNVAYLEPAYAIVRYHHERWDGAGYPMQLKAEDIPLPARIFAIADTLDAITTQRPYRDARTFPAAYQEIKRMNGTQFDPRVVEAFLTLPEQAWKDAAKQIES